jgi:hypothetical protein
MVAKDRGGCCSFEKYELIRSKALPAYMYVDFEHLKRLESLQGRNNSVTYRLDSGICSIIFINEQ